MGLWSIMPKSTHQVNLRGCQDGPAAKMQAPTAMNIAPVYAASSQVFIMMSTDPSKRDEPIASRAPIAIPPARPSEKISPIRFRPAYAEADRIVSPALCDFR
jgi:hypothetical protein